MIKETLQYHHYINTVRRISQIDPLVTLTVTDGMNCPKCRRLLPALEHGQTQVCDNCDLRMTLNGNALECELPS